MNRSVLIGAGLATLASLGACGESKQIILSVDTTAGIPCDIDKLRIRATGDDANTLERDLTNERLPITITLEDDTSSGSFDLQVTALKGNVEVLQAAGTLQFGQGRDLAARVVLESTCTPATPCLLPELIPYTAPPAPVSARTECGANVRRYVPGPTTEIFRDSCTTPTPNSGKVLTGGKRGAELLPLSETALAGFGFRFYGRPIRQIWAHEDGYISFAPDNPDALNDLDPGPFDRDIKGIGVPPPKQSVFPFWDGLTLTGTNGVCYALEGSPGTQKLRVTWARACHTLACDTNNNLNFTIVLDERTGRIAFTYGSMVAQPAERAAGQTATSGIVNDATGCTVDMCNKDTGLCADGMTPCGYNQLFSSVPQSPKIQDVQFDPQPEGE